MRYPTPVCETNTGWQLVKDVFLSNLYHQRSYPSLVIIDPMPHLTEASGV